MKKLGSFEAAVDFAIKFLTMSSRPGPIASPIGLDPGDLRDYRLQRWGLQELSSDPAGLVRKARRDPAAHDALRMAIAFELFLERKLPREATEWLVEYLHGRRERPSAPPGRGTSLGAKLLLYALVSFLVEGGLTATRSDATEGGSACDAVAEAMSRLGRRPSSYSRVKAIYEEVRKKDDGSGLITYDIG